MLERKGFRHGSAGGGLGLLLALALAAAPVAGFALALRPPTPDLVVPLASSADATRVTSTTGQAAPGLPRGAIVARGSLGTPAAGPIAASGRGTFAPAQGPEAGTITVGSGHAFDPLVQGEPPVPSALTQGPLGPGETGSFLVQLRGPTLTAQRAQLEAAGARIVGYLPHHAFLVRMSAEESAAVGAMPFVRWVGAYQPAYKISPQPETRRDSGPGTVVVLLFPDADLAGERAAVRALGGAIVEATDSGRNKILRATLDMSRLPEIARRGHVAWIEPWHERTFGNATAQWVVQTNTLNLRRVWDMGLHGQGQVVHISDSGIRTSHNAFRDDLVPIDTFGEYPTHRKVIAYLAEQVGILFGDHSGASNHGTHVAGTVAGDDSPFATDLRDGHALKAKIYFTDVGNNSTSVFVPSDMALVFAPAYAGNAGGAARISTNSWGSPVNEYDVQSMTVDQFMWDHTDFLVFFANGNTAGPGTVGSPAGNKNGLGIGNCQNGANSGLKSASSSEGPTADGRLKPTIMAPGQSIQSADGAGTSGYKSLTGTSMASPAAAGGTTLIRQYLTEGWYPTGTPNPAHAFTPSGALLKAMAITSTDNDMVGHNVPDFTMGWGRIKLDNVLYFAGDAVRTALVEEPDGVATGEFVEYQVRVTDPAVSLKITLCWTDRAALPGPGIKLVNDLDLTVTDPGGLTYLGNVFVAGESQTAGTPDRLNVEEGVRRGAPAAGVWTIRVSGANVPLGPQPFALAVTGGVGATAGVVRLDRQTYGRSDVIQVRVEDLNGGPEVEVAFTSSAEATPEVVTLGGTDAVYTGSIATTAFAPQPDGLLSVAHGGTITAAYHDQDPSGTVVATAAADFDGPVITEVRAVDEGAYQSIRWTTDVLARGRVHYGTTPGLGQATGLDPTLRFSHALPLAGLLPETDYWFDVEAADHGGNVTRDDNGGLHYRLRTGKRGEVLVVLGDGSFTDLGLYGGALRERGWSPALLAGGTLQSLPLGDRDSGLRSHLAVLWQSGLEQYPPLQDESRASLSEYLEGGGRLGVTGHDIAWAFTDLSSGHADAERTAWLASTLHLQFLEDPLAWTANLGIAGDPISGAYVAGVAYAPHRAGAAGDEVAVVPGTGAGAYTWLNTDATPDHIGFRWENGVPDGDPAAAVWGGKPSRLVYNGFEWAGIVDPMARADILDKTVIWLVGNDHPDATVLGPNGGEAASGDQVTISWTEAAHGGAAVGSRSLYYSSDGGSSWTLIAKGVGPSPYAWDIGGLPNGTRYRVRVEVADDGDPALVGRDASDADFALDRPVDDPAGPVVVAGSIKISPNPMDNRSEAALTATLTDEGHGGSSVAAAEYSWGESPMPAGSGTPMSGSFDAATADVSGTVPPSTVPTGEQTVWVRGRDEGGSWGPASGRTVVVNGDATVAVGAEPLAFALHQSVPNPARGGAIIGFALPRSGDVELALFGLRGERVRTLVSGMLPAGRRSVAWDGRDDHGRPVPSGVYFYRLVAGDRQAGRKLVLVR
jgi:hypothetical protein